MLPELGLPDGTLVWEGRWLISGEWTLQPVIWDIHLRGWMACSIQVGRSRTGSFDNVDIQWISQLVLPAVVGGFAGSAAFYFQWDVEKRRAKLARRSSLVDAWRTNLLEDWPTQNGIGVIPPGGLSVCSRPDYASLRPHLTEDYRSRIEGAQPGAGKLSAPTTVIVGYNTLRMGMVSEIGRIERLWGLV